MSAIEQLEAVARHLDACVEISTQQWAFAWLLGEARRNSNKHRAERSSRQEKNEGVDLHGALGELLLYGTVRRLGLMDAASYMLAHLYIEGGGRDAYGPDLMLGAKSSADRVGLDVKTFDCSTNKRYFAINDDKHQELAGQCHGYVGLICPPFASSAYLTRVIPYAHVCDWKCWNLRRDDTNGSPSRNLSITTAVALYTAQSYSFAEARARAHPRDDVLVLARATGPKSVAARLARMLPQISGAMEEAQRTVGVRRST